MVSISKTNWFSSGWALLCVAVVGSTPQLYAQNYDSLIAKYKDENAVVIRHKEHMVISSEDGKLKVATFVNHDKLFISDLSRDAYNQDYLYHSDFFELTDIDANLLVPGKDGYREIPCGYFSDVNPSDGDVFYDDNRVMVISYSGVLKHSVSKTYYEIDDKDIHMLAPFYYQGRVPVDKAVFEVTAPKTVEMGFILRGPDTGSIKRSVKELGDFVTYKFSVHDVPALLEVGNVPSSLYYLNQVIPYIKSYKLSESSKKVDVLANTDQLYKHMYGYIRGRDLKDDTLIDRTVKEITKNDATPREKAMHIYQWVQQNMHYIAFEKGLEGFIPHDPDKIIRHKYGDCKDMTALLVSMCLKAGLDAHYTWIGTRDIPYLSENVPLPLLFNHMICALKLDGDWVFLDGTHPFIPFGHYPEGIEGKEAMIAVDAKNYKIVPIPVVSAPANVVSDSMEMSFSGHMIGGTVQQHYKGYPAWTLGVYKMYMDGPDKDKWVRSLVYRGDASFSDSGYHVKAEETGDRDAHVSADFSVDHYVHKVGHQYFVNMNLRKTYPGHFEDPKERKVPVYNDYMRTVREVAVLNVPRGYRIVHVPEGAHGVIDGLCSYDISYKVKKNRITLVKEIQTNALMTRPDMFASSNKLIQNLSNLYNESVVLTGK